jgi:WD40 repeat protein
MAHIGIGSEPSAFSVLQQRQLVAVASKGFDRFLLQSLRRTDVLEGHDGCVNRLAWNESGSMLASASDDLKVLLWPFNYWSDPAGSAGRPFEVSTMHSGNIFGVGFLPRSHSSLIITGSMDGLVQLHRLERGDLCDQMPVRQSSRQHGETGSVPLGGDMEGEVHHLSPTRVATHTQTFSCHTDRVKDVEVCLHEPSLFWSCGEDGTVRQFDIRIRNAEQNSPSSRNVLIHSPNINERAIGGWFSKYGKYRGISSVRVNQQRPEMIAVATQSPDVLVFDRRMTSLTVAESQVEIGLGTGCARPNDVPLMQLKYPVREMLRHAEFGMGEAELDIRPTYLSWGSKGDKIVATYSSGPAVTWSTTLEEPRGICSGPHVTCKKAHHTYKVEDVDAIEKYWNEYCFNIPFDVEQSMSDLRRVSTGYGMSMDDSSPIRGMKRALSEAVSWEELNQIEYWDILREIGTTFSLFVHEDPGVPDLDKEFLSLLYGEYTFRIGPRIASNLLYLIAKPLYELCFEFAAAFIAQMVSQQVWSFSLVDDSDCIEGEWMTRSEVEDYANNLTKLAKVSWVKRHFNSRRKERTIGARMEEQFIGVVRAMVTAASSGTFDPTHWAGMECSNSHGFSLSNVEASYIKAWVTYFSRSRSDKSANTPVMLLGFPSRSFHQVYVYHSNNDTDIKEAVFFGSDDSFVMCASDSGAVAVYDEVGEVVCYLESDETIANCVRPHPSLPIIATSGIDDTVKIWSPYHGEENHVVTDDTKLASFWKSEVERQTISDFGGIRFAIQGGSMGFAEFLLGLNLMRPEDNMGSDQESE